MMAIQTAYQAYDQLHKSNEEPRDHDEEKGGIIHDIKESVKEVVHQLSCKDNDPSDSETLVENEVTPAVVEDDEIPEFSKTGYVNRTLNTFTPQDSFDSHDNFMPDFNESVRPRPPSRRTSKTDRELISQAGDDILEIKVVPATHTFIDSNNGKLIDAGNHVEVHCESNKLEN